MAPYSAPFRYTPEWYAGPYVESWVAQASTVEGLAALHEQQGRYKRRLEEWFEWIQMSGRVLELGFNDGKSVHWLCQMKPEIESIDLLDWSPILEQVLPALELLVPKISTVLPIDILDLEAENEYDHVLALDFFEHLPSAVYSQALPIVARALKPRGRIYVYFGTTKQPEHVNRRELGAIECDLSGHFEEISAREADGHTMFVARKSSC